MLNASPTSASHASDAELALRIAAHEQGAFELLMRRHNQRLFRTARSILRDDSEAEDVLQEAYLQAYRAIGQFRGDAQLSTWLTRIVVNQAIARTRQTSRRADVMQLHADAEALLEQDGTPGRADGESPELGAMRGQTRALMERAIDGLPEVFRTVFVLRAVEELSGEDVAACLGIPEATVRSRYFRARAQLRATLARELDVALEDAYAFDGARCDRIVAATLAAAAKSFSSASPVSSASSATSVSTATQASSATSDSLAPPGDVRAP